MVYLYVNICNAGVELNLNIHWVKSCCSDANVYVGKTDCRWHILKVVNW